MSKQEKKVVTKKAAVVESTVEIKGGKEILVTKENGEVVSEQEV